MTRRASLLHRLDALLHDRPNGEKDSLLLMERLSIFMFALVLSF